MCQHCIYISRGQYSKWKPQPTRPWTTPFTTTLPDHRTSVIFSRLDYCLTSEERPMSTITRRGFVKRAALAPLALAPLASRAQPAAPGDKLDFVIAGAGHNSLVCAAYLAKAGYRVVVLEGRPTIGGGVK